MPIDSQLRIFLSYSWSNSDVADAIDNDFKSVGITFQRDVRDVSYTENIKKFMQLIGVSNFIVMLISDEYIKSENCMYEVTELLNTHEFEKRILPVILENASIYNSDQQEKYYDYWLEKLNNVSRIFAKHQNEKTIEDKKKVQNIYDNLGLFFQKISDLVSEKFEDLKEKNYKPMLDKIGFDDNEILTEVIAIMDISDNEEQDLAIEELLSRYPANKHVLFQRAYIQTSKKSFKKAKKYYENLLCRFPCYASAHNNLAIILKNTFRDFATAKKH